MKIDRASFLFLTATIAAAGACAEQQVSAPPPVDVPLPLASNTTPIAPATTTAAPDPPAPVAAPKPRTRPAPHAEGWSAGEGGPAGEGYSAGEGDDDASDQGFCGHSPMQFDAKRTGCTDNVGAPASCASMQKPRGCGSFAFPRAHCDSFSQNMKPKIAERAVACVNALSGKEVCDACKSYQCGYEALMSACVDTSADTDCSAILKACPASSAAKRAGMAECRAYLSGLNAAGRRQMVTCMIPGRGCDWGFYSCSEGL